MYLYIQTRKIHYLLCHATIKNYYKINIIKKYYFYINMGKRKDKKPKCLEGYDIISNSKVYFD